MATPNPPASIPSEVASHELDIIALQDPIQIRAYTISVAKQINDQRMKYAPQKRVANLSDAIQDIIIETSAQGASLLEVHIIDTGWDLFTRDESGTCFIDADPDGYLWPPIEVNFPEGASDCFWRLAQARPSTDLSQANVILTFEDRIVAELREYGGPVQSNPQETRAEFIRRLVKEVQLGNQVQTGITTGERDSRIRFVPLLPTSVFTAADLAGQGQPASNAANGRNALKTPGAPTGNAAGNLAAAAGSGVSTVELILNQGQSLGSGALGAVGPAGPVGPTG